MRNIFTAAMLSGIIPAVAQSQKPNIIFFLVDDMGWQDTSVQFWDEQTPQNRRYRTPNMEKLAQQGVMFTNAYACPVSSPSRSSLLSGMNAARHGVTNWIEGKDQNTNNSGGSITLPAWNWNGVQPTGNAAAQSVSNCTLITPLPQLLKANGYMTIHCGKGNFGSQDTPGANPLNLGYDVNIAGGYKGGPGSYLASDNYGSAIQAIGGLEEYAAKGEFLSEALTQEALKNIQIAVNKQKPFYLYMSHYAIHTPYQADTRFTGNYEGIVDEQFGTTLNSSERNRAALIEGMDKSLGDIMQYLDDNPEVAQNTVILFMSDNGGQGVSPRQGTLNRDPNYPARGGKGSCYDGGVHEPMIVSWPGHYSQGAKNTNHVMIEDFFPSILDLAGVTDYTTVQTVDGKSFVDLLEDNTIVRERPIVWHYPNRWGETQDTNEGYGAWSAYMKGDYHLLYFWEKRELRLYNLREDRGEQNNLAESEPEILAEMAKALTDSLKNYGAARPTKAGKYVIWPDEAVELVGKEIPHVVSGHVYTIQPYTNQTKYLYAVSASTWGTSAGTKKVQYTTTPTMENGAYWSITGSEGAYLLRPADPSYASGLWLNPRGSDNPGYVGTYTSGQGNDCWSIDAVDGFTNVFTINGNKHTNDYFYYRATVSYLQYLPGADVVPTEANYFVLTDVTPEGPDYSEYLPQLTEDTDAPVLYTIKNVRRGQYADYAQGFTSYMYTVTEPTETSRYFFTGSKVEDHLSVKIHNTQDKSIALNGRNSWAQTSSAYNWTITGTTINGQQGVTIQRDPDSDNSRAWYMGTSGTYVDYGAPTSAGSLWLIEKVEDSPTGISEMSANTTNALTYDLQGRVATPNQKGIFIQNGKKVVIR